MFMIKPKLYSFTSSGIMIIMMCISCVRNYEPISHEDAGKMFEKSINLLVLYTDSISKATDSTQVEGLINAYEYKINAINFEFPPDTDLRLTEEENDSLIKMIDRLVAARKERLKHFALPLAINTDSVPFTDTISNRQEGKQSN